MTLAVAAAVVAAAEDAEQDSNSKINKFQLDVLISMFITSTYRKRK